MNAGPLVASETARSGPVSGGDARRRSLGALVTGATVGLLGVRHALLVNGGLALALQVVLSRFWLRPASPEPAHGT